MATTPEEDRGASIVGRIAEKIGGSIGAQSVFGAPVERNGVTVIPVARARWGFGGGGGTQPDGDGGSGGGGGAQVGAAGYIVVSDDDVRYEPIRRPELPMLAAGVLLFLALAARWLLRR